MCLQTTWKRPKKAKEDITIYKLVDRWAGKYTSPYSDYPIEYEVGNEYTATMKTVEDTEHFDPIAGYALSDAISAGEKIKSIGPGLHGALKKERFVTFSAQKVMVCIIPKGTKYYEGLSELVVAEKLRVVKIL